MSLDPNIKDILDKQKELAHSKKDAAYTTSLCVVGKDMEKGIYLAEDFLNEFFNTCDPNDLSKYKKIHLELNILAQDYDGPDAEGYVVGTLIDIANQIAEL